MGTLSSVSKFSWGQNKTNPALPLRGGSGSFLHFRSYCCCKRKYLNRLVTPTQLEAFELPHIVKKGIWNAEINNLYLSQVPSQFFILIFHAAVLLYKWFPKPSQFNEFALRVSSISQLPHVISVTIVTSGYDKSKQSLTLLIRSESPRKMAASQEYRMF